MLSVNSYKQIVQQLNVWFGLTTEKHYIGSQHVVILFCSEYLSLESLEWFWIFADNVLETTKIMIK